MKKLFAVAACMVLAACQTTGYKPVAEKLPMLEVAFAGGAWGGKTVPADQVCKIFDGNGSTPMLKVSGVPAGANAILVEFNDRDYQPLSTNGGHGIVGFWIDQTGTVTLNSVPGHTADVGGNAFIEAAARSRNKYATSGYLPPCSGGRNHLYFADVKAVYKPKAEGEEGKLLAQGRIDLGKF